MSDKQVPPERVHALKQSIDESYMKGFVTGEQHQAANTLIDALTRKDAEINRLSVQLGQCSLASAGVGLDLSRGDVAFSESYDAVARLYRKYAMQAAMLAEIRAHHSERPCWCGSATHPNRAANGEVACYGPTCTGCNSRTYPCWHIKVLDGAE